MTAEELKQMRLFQEIMKRSKESGMRFLLADGKIVQLTRDGRPISKEISWCLQPHTLAEWVSKALGFNDFEKDFVSAYNFVHPKDQQIKTGYLNVFGGFDQIASYIKTYTDRRSFDGRYVIPQPIGVLANGHPLQW